jgi:NAD(P)-dependent dehydrogenase (short-subunit alcohol dehydrogenase family)
LKGRVAIVTGGARGIGEAICRMFADRGARVVICDIDGSAAECLATDILSSGGHAVASTADVSQRDAVAELISKTVETYQTVDVLVNNAGVLRPTGLLDIEEEEWDWIMSVNLKAPFLCTQVVVPVMVDHGYGRIVNISSSAGRSTSTLGGAHYTASKAGLLGLTRHTAREVAPYGITANAVCPGLIDTEMVRNEVDPQRMGMYAESFPISRLGTPGEVAELVAFLASEAAGYITGATFDINGGDLMI